MTNGYEELGVHRSSFCGVPINVTYRYIDAEECGWDVELLAAHLRGYPDIDVKEGLSDEWIDICEADAGYHHYDEQGKAGSSPEDYEPFESLVSILGLSYLYAKDKELACPVIISPLAMLGFLDQGEPHECFFWPKSVELKELTIMKAFCPQ